MNFLYRIAPFCLLACALAVCDSSSKQGAVVNQEPMAIHGYKLGLNEKSVMEQSNATCHNHPEKLDADSICSASTSIAGQPALLFFYFYDGVLERLVLTVLPRHGQLSEVNRKFLEELESKYGKPSSNNTSTVIWSHKGETITINHGDERTMSVNLTSKKYDIEKSRRATASGRGTEI